MTAAHTFPKPTVSFDLTTSAGMSEKSIPRRRLIGPPLLARRPTPADDTAALVIASPPHGIGHNEHAAGRRAAQAQQPRLLLGMTQIRTVKGIGVTEHGPRLFERDSVLGTVNSRLPRVPLEHGSVYTKLRVEGLLHLGP